MQVLNDFILNNNKYSVVTIGNFDGIHTGHKKLITTTRKLAIKNNFNSIVITFAPHPIQALYGKQFSYILSKQEKSLEVQNQNIDFFINYNFTKDFANTTPIEFINILKQNLNCKILVVGEDYCFGKNRAGNTELLEKICADKDIKFIKISNIIINNKKISSSSIRECLIQGDIKQANILLNKPYYITGTVCEGNKLGRTIGFPTANIIPDSTKLLPKEGVYITQTLLNNQVLNSVTNIGRNPSIKNKNINTNNLTVETFIFNFSQNIYDMQIKILFLDWIRGVNKFDSLDDLKNQITKDRNLANQFFINNK